MTRSKFEQQVEALRTALIDRTASHALLDKTLRSGNGHLVGMIADALDESDSPLLGLLPDAFARLLHDPVKRDPGCPGKTAIAKALDRTEQREHAVFERGVQHVQHEPVWGGKVDTAAELRGVCSMALVHAHHPRALVFVAVLLADPESRARMAAARALAASGDRIASEPLLRLRIAIGDGNPEVLGECFAALLELVSADAIADVAVYLRHADAPIADAAALALGGSRLPGAFAALREADETLVGGDTRRVRLLGIALVRQPAAWDYLVELVARASSPAAEDAARALATFRHDAELMARLMAAAERREERSFVALVAALLADETPC